MASSNLEIHSNWQSTLNASCIRKKPHRNHKEGVRLSEQKHILATHSFWTQFFSQIFRFSSKKLRKIWKKNQLNHGIGTLAHQTSTTFQQRFSDRSRLSRSAVLVDPVSGLQAAADVPFKFQVHFKFAASGWKWIVLCKSDPLSSFQLNANISDSRNSKSSKIPYNSGKNVLVN